MLNILEGFDLVSMEPSSADRIHLEVEAKKLAFEDLHGRIGDPEFSEIPTAELLSKEYAARLRGSISSDAAAVVSPPDPGGDTTYLCAVDAEGNGCSFINSLYKGFGSGIVAEGTGVCLHNRGNSFRLEPGRPNAIAPGKRPMHTLIPGLATSDGALWAVFGVMGAAMQPQGHAHVLVDLLDYGMDPQEAVEHPRHRHENGVLLIEGRLPEEEIASLRGRGHRIEVKEDFMIPAGGAQLIRILDNGVRACGSDPRKDGCALAQ
jgi:gamma-glutamyltranspeptidase / glutathione hydrolase